MNGRVNQGPNLMVFWSAKIAEYNKRKKNVSSGFSLVELIIVIAIMAILAAVVTPVLIRYINKSRKAVDIETAQTIYEAANLASASYDDGVAEGWTVAAMWASDSDVARTTVTNSGHNTLFDSTASASERYVISCVSWARGVNYNGGSGVEWQNAQFKSTIDSGPKGDLQRQYTNEFLKNLVHDNAVGAVYYPKGKNNFDGFSSQTMVMKFKADAGYGEPECWMVCIRSDNHKPEIWIGDKNFNGRGTGQKVRPLYRIYPDPCKEYRE